MRPEPDFATFLDDLFDADAATRGPVRLMPSFDYLAVAEELCSGRIRVSEDTVAAEYEAFGAEEPKHVPPVLATDEAAIAAELGVHRYDSAGLAQLRRSFALRNHPDRRPPQLRAAALTRMQIANALIDAALARLGA